MNGLTRMDHTGIKENDLKRISLSFSLKFLLTSLVEALFLFSFAFFQYFYKLLDVTRPHRAFPPSKITDNVSNHT